MAQKIIKIKEDKQGLALYFAKNIYYGDSNPQEMDIACGENSIVFSEKQAKELYGHLGERFDSAQKKRISELEKELRELREELDNKGMERDFEMD